MIFAAEPDKTGIDSDPIEMLETAVAQPIRTALPSDSSGGDGGSAPALSQLSPVKIAILGGLLWGGLRTAIKAGGIAYFVTKMLGEEGS